MRSLRVKPLRVLAIDSLRCCWAGFGCEVGKSPRAGVATTILVLRNTTGIILRLAGRIAPPAALTAEAPSRVQGGA
jgi:hypothetical protein